MRRALPLTLAAAIALTTLASRPAFAGFPITSESSVDPCIVVCPAGDIVLHVVAKRNGHWSGDPVWSDFCGCPGVHFALLDGSENYYVDPGGCFVAATPLSTGILDLPFKAGGTCSGANIVFSVFIPDNFVRTSVASPDQNGDLVVSATDLAIATARLGTSDPAADFNCDGAVTSADLALLQAHMGHHWAGATPTAARSWGRVKLLYR